MKGTRTSSICGRIRLRAKLLIVLSIVLVSDSAQAQDHRLLTDSRGAQIEYTTDSDEPLLSVTIEGPFWLVRGAPRDFVPVLRIYGSGRVLVFSPEAVRKESGAFDLQLSREDLEQYLLQISEEGVLDFDEEGVKNQIAGIEEQRKLEAEQSGDRYTVAGSTDAVTIVIEISLKRYAPPDSPGSGESPFRKRVAWNNLSHQAWWYPEADALAGLDRVWQNLYMLARHEDLKKV